MKVEVFEKLMKKTNYNPQEIRFLVDGFTSGFSLNYRGPCNRKDTSKNIPFMPGIGDSLEMWNEIMKEVKANRYVGPFENIPFEYFIQSPIGLVPKAGRQTRLIFHLSYDFPNGNKSVNYWTLKELCTVKYNDLDHAVDNSIKMIHQLKSEQLEIKNTLFYGKMDLKSAFRQAPLKESMWPLLILKATCPSTGSTFYFVDKCLPFGASISCSHFQRLSNALKHVVENLECSYHTITNYLDDFLFLHYI